MRKNERKPRLIIILGPTGVGKTEMAIKLAGLFKGEVISADSMQVYRYMDIGTAKPTRDERQTIRHHLIDVVNPDEEFNAAIFNEKSAIIIERLYNAGTNIFLVGGTGLYIKTLLGGLFDGPGADKALRDSYTDDVKEHGIGYLYARLKYRDAIAAQRIHPHDRVRIVRALEVIESSGESIVTKQEEHRFGNNRYKFLKIGLNLDRRLLYDRIDKRTAKMIADGLVEEVKSLLKMGFSGLLKPMQSMCYKHIHDYIRGTHVLEEAVRLVKRDTRRYAKRQMTWFRRDNDIVWHHPHDIKAIIDEIENFLDV
ncbi:MAG: tRNA (adenosine(37)-N6)-dimethylallyltransferase MiaA [Deltaproteobacteria bacterium]|nr:tRNA (adenosine(37)-N6)-dimethylallyltransferase MiaA [Deltaproteobacteria bacterium]